MSETVNIKKIFGSALRELRESKNLTQEQLAERLNLQTYQTINRIENGKSFITSELFEAMCKFFDVAPFYFFINRYEVLNKDCTDYSHKIKQLLPLLSSDRLKDVYNIILTFQD